MSPADRKQIVDMIFEMEVINVVYENIKKDMRDLGSSINADNTTIFSPSLNTVIELGENFRSIIYVCWPCFIVPFIYPFLLIRFAIAVLGNLPTLPYNNKTGNDNIADFPAPDTPFNKISLPVSS